MRRLAARTLERIWSRDVARDYRDAVRLETCGGEAIYAYQLTKLNALLRHFRGWPFFNALLENCGAPRDALRSLDQMDQLPKVSKDDILKNLSAIAAQPEALRYNATSGSTGKSFRFYQSKSMLVGRRAAFRRGREWMGIDAYADRCVNVWGQSPALGALHRLKLGLKQFLMNATVLDGFGLDDERCRSHIRRIARIKPRLIVGYPNYLLALARAGQSANIAPHRAHAIVSSGETLFVETRKEIEAYFGAPVYNRYGSREFGPIAHECETRDVLHVHAHRFIVETDNDGELLITDLDNLATPFIRYRVGDAGRVDFVACSCGRSLPSIVAMEGRSHDVIRTPSGRQLPGQFWTIISKVVEGIDEFQLVQRTPSELEMRIKVNDHYRDEFAQVLREKVRDLAGDEMTLNVVKVAEIEQTAGGKRRFIINLVDAPADG